jgi:hypothetical protein
MLGLEAHHLQLDQGRVAHQVVRQRALFAQRKGHVVQHAEGRVQRAMLEQHAHAAGSALAAHFAGRAAQHLDAALGGLQQPQHLAQQHGLARARSADDGQHLAALHIEVQVLVHGKGVLAFAEHAPQSGDAHDGLAGCGRCTRAVLVYVRHLSALSHETGAH